MWSGERVVMPLFRKILFYVFLAGYLVACPVIVLYSLGYILTPGAGNGVAKAGLIDVSTLPPGATVYLGNKRYTQKTPAVISGLLPGQYRVTVYLKGYALWSREVSVQAEQAAVFDHILLLPKQWRADYL